MAVDKKISQLTSLAQVDVSASTDVLPIVDTSATETKKITVSALVGAGATAGISGAVLTNGTINSTTIGATTPSTGAFTTLSASGNFTLSGGTANGVLYLNGSKVATSGTSLAYDGTNLSLGAAWTNNPMRPTTAPLYFQYASTGNNILAVMGDNVVSSVQVNRFSDNTTAPNINMGKARGTYASPTAVQTGDFLGSLQFRGYGGTTSRTLAQIDGFVETYTSDTNIASGLYFATSSSGVASATEKMRLDSSGNLGIGTGSPSQKLSIVGTSTFNSFGSGPQITMADTSGRTLAFVAPGSVVDAYVGTITNHTLNFMTGGTGRATIDTSGNLGIGTTSPIYKLHVENNAASTTNIAVLNTSASSGAYAQVRVQGDSGIGYFGYAGSGNAAGGLYDADCVYLASESTAAALCIGTSGGSAPIRFFTNGSTAASERMRLDSSGNLGLGVTTDLNLGVSNCRGLSIGGTTTYAGIQIRNSTGNLEFFVGGESAVDALIRNNMNGPLRFGTNGTERVRIDASGNVGIGTASLNAYDKVTVGGTLPSSAGNSIAYIVRGTTPSGTTLDSISFGSVFSTQAASFTLARATHFYASQSTIGAGSTVTNQFGFFVDSNLTGATNNYGFYSDIASASNRWNFYAAGTAANYFAGTTTVGTTNVSPAAGNVAGVAIGSTGYVSASRSGDVAGGFNRGTNDGDIITLHQDGTQEGSISVSGNTISYNAFAGSHWSQLQNGSKPDILRGTVMESINELCVWPDENNERLPKSKISDTAGSKKVYGVFMAWDNDWTATNDMLVTSVGAFICRVNSSVTVQEGDLLESNGDGTARVQADDIIRSSTIGKVTSTVKTHQYADGSYCVPTVLYCG